MVKEVVEEDKGNKKEEPIALVLEEVRDLDLNFDDELLHKKNYFYKFDLKSILVVIFLEGSFNGNTNIFSLILFQDSQFSTKSG